MQLVEIINWGGEVGLSGAGGGGGAFRTTTDMGNGHYPSEGFTKSAFVSGALYLGDDNQNHEPYGASFSVDNPSCYDIQPYGMGYFNRSGYTFLFGGNGTGDGCFLTG
ncbi:hypothetical protein ACLOJK_023176 [Asimina triloba]